MWVDVLNALALVLVFEGMMPFLSPQVWKRLLARVLRQDDRALQIAGFMSMMFGVVLITVVHQLVD